MFTLSLHELTACIYYKLAIERGLRGCNPEGELLTHQNTDMAYSNNNRTSSNNFTIENINYDCHDASDIDINEAIR